MSVKFIVGIVQGRRWTYSNPYAFTKSTTSPSKADPPVWNATRGPARFPEMFFLALGVRLAFISLGFGLGFNHLGPLCLLLGFWFWVLGLGLGIGAWGLGSGFQAEVNSSTQHLVRQSADMSTFCARRAVCVWLGV